MAINAAGSLWESCSQENYARIALTWKPLVGWIGISDSLLGLLLCGGSMVLCYALFKIGGGDVKLMALCGAFLGMERGVETLLWTIVLGAAVAIVVLVWRVGAVNLLARGLRQIVWLVRIANWTPLTPEEKAHLQVRLHLAPAALAALTVVECSHRFGWY